MPWPASLPDPLLSDYGLKQTSPSSRLQMDSGDDRVRPKTTTSPTLFNATWLFTDVQLDTFKAFYQSINGVDYFSIDLKNGLGVSTMSARMLGGYSLLTVGGKYKVTTVLEVQVKPTISEAALDARL